MSIARNEGEDHIRKKHAGYGIPSERRTGTVGGGGYRGDERMALHPALKSAFEALNLAGVSWCLVRLPSSPAAPTGDVDLLVDRADNGRTRWILRTLGFGRLPVWGRRDPEAFYLLYHPSTGHNICLHVVTELSFGPDRAIRTGAEAGCLRRRRRRGVLFEPGSNDAFWVLLLHCLLDKGSVASRYRASLQELATSARAGGELAGAAERVCPAGWDASKMLEHVHRGDWASLERLAKNLKKPGTGWQPFDRGLRLAAALLGVLSSRSAQRYAWGKVRFLVLSSVKKPRPEQPTGASGTGEGRAGTRTSEVRKILWFVRRNLQSFGEGSSSIDGLGRQCGLTVALLGPDGVGKSTLIASVQRSARRPVRKLYMGLGYAGLPRLARVPVPGARAAVGLVTLWWRCLLAYHHRRQGRLVLFDRYTYDALLPPGRHLTGPQRFARWVWAHACPPPDLVLLLDAPGEVVYGRRGEGEPTLLEATRRDFLSLRERIPQLQVVDASRPEEAVRADIADRIRRWYEAREDAAFGGTTRGDD